MDHPNAIIPWLVGATLVLVIGILLWYRRRAQISREIRGEEGHVSHPPPDRHTTTPGNPQP